MKTLLIAPFVAELSGQRAEVQDIVNSGLNVELVQGYVTVQDVIRACGRDEYDVLWFTGHGTRQGVVLSENHVMTVVELVSAVRSCGAKLVILNSCESVALANQIAEDTQASVIATIADVPDDIAYATGSVFARWLAKTKDPVQAFQMARSGNSNYLFIPGAHFMRSAPQDKKQCGNGGVMNQLQELQRQLFEHRVVTDAAIRDLRRRVDSRNLLSTPKAQFWLIIVLLIFLSITMSTTLWLLFGGGASP